MTFRSTGKSLKSRRGSNGIEYGLMLVLVTVVSLPAISRTGATINGTFGDANDTVSLHFGASSPEPVVEESDERDPNCYEAANVGTVGAASWNGCAGMYIIDTTEFRGITRTGTSTYQVDHAGNTYTLANSSYNIFTGQVTSMAAAFGHDSYAGRPSFNDDISYFDTSNVTNFERIFEFNALFDQDINAWNTSSVTNALRAFRGASAFNKPLNDWDVSNVTDFTEMFSSASSFDQDLSKWDVSAGITFNFMMSYTKFNQDISGWTPTSATALYRMFGDTSDFNQDLSGWVFGEASVDCRNINQRAASWTEPKPICP